MRRVNECETVCSACEVLKSSWVESWKVLGLCWQTVFRNVCFVRSSLCATAVCFCLKQTRQSFVCLFVCFLMCTSKLFQIVFIGCLKMHVIPPSFLTFCSTFLPKQRWPECKLIKFFTLLGKVCASVGRGRVCLRQDEEIWFIYLYLLRLFKAGWIEVFWKL